MLSSENPSGGQNSSTNDPPHIVGSAKRILLIRAFKQLKGGGPIPPLGILYLASAIRRHFGVRFDVQVVDTGLIGVEGAIERLNDFDPHFVGVSYLSCEADVAARLAAAAKRNGETATVIAGGPHSMVGREAILDDANIDYVVIGEGERTLVELLAACEDGGDLSAVDGIAYRAAGGAVRTRERALIDDLDSIAFPVFDLVDLAEYSKTPNWNGPLKRGRYAPLLTSRGCPYKCSFCHRIFGKKPRMRSPGNVMAEIELLRKESNANEFHIIDDVFNCDESRARRICEMVAATSSDIALSFPNGLRADTMTDELIWDLKRAGTYKINYGFETTSARLQLLVGKNLDIPRTVRAIDATAAAGIITGAYFMLGLPTQTRDEIEETIDFAVESNLDVAYFFKTTNFPGSGEPASAETEGTQERPTDYSAYHFYSVDRTGGEVEQRELNELLLKAQYRFYLKPRRLWRGFWKTPSKVHYLRNLLSLFAMLIQSSIFNSLANSTGKAK